MLTRDRRSDRLGKALKRSVLFLAKWLGLFRLMRKATGRRLRILCYHGFGLEDEVDFSPRLFISPTTFQRRMRWLRRAGIPILPLESALELLGEKRLPPAATVVTVDDGWYSAYQIALPELESLSIPATVYVTTYYMPKEIPVYQLVVRYMFWKTPHDTLRLNELDTGLPQVAVPKGSESANTAMRALMEYGAKHCTEEQRVAICRQLGKRLDVDYEDIVRSRKFTLMKPAQVREMAGRGIDIQLHTHRHQLPANEDRARAEILDNRAALEPLAQRPLVHFCYPKGLWAPEQGSWLRESNVVSAVTCDPGLNDANSNPLRLRRFLDSESVSQIEFEAEISGFADLLRCFRSLAARMKKLLKTKSIQGQERREGNPNEPAPAAR